MFYSISGHTASSLRHLQHEISRHKLYEEAFVKPFWDLQNGLHYHIFTY